jgi:hypothetical protein
MTNLSQKSDDIWLFRCYGPGDEQGGFNGWYAGLPAKVRAEIDAALEILTASKKWPEALYEELHGGGEGLAEIKVEVPTNDPKKSEHYRLLGFRSAPGEFVILNGFKKERTSDYGPAIASALRRKQGVERDGKRASPCQFP